MTFLPCDVFYFSQDWTLGRSVECVTALRETQFLVCGNWKGLMGVEWGRTCHVQMPIFVEILILAVRLCAKAENILDPPVRVYFTL